MTKIEERDALSYLLQKETTDWTAKDLDKIFEFLTKYQDEGFLLKMKVKSKSKSAELSHYIDAIVDSGNQLIFELLKATCNVDLYVDFIKEVKKYILLRNENIELD